MPTSGPSLSRFRSLFSFVSETAFYPFLTKMRAFSNLSALMRRKCIFFCTAFFRLEAGKDERRPVFTRLHISLSFFQGTRFWRQETYSALDSKWPGAGRSARGKPATCSCCRCTVTFLRAEGRRSEPCRSCRRQILQSPSRRITSKTGMWHSFRKKAASHYISKIIRPSVRRERTGSPSRWVAYLPTLAIEHN